ncbi:MAG: cadherin-like beta sandwich domain-containing protein, partial [Bacilli bacterium]
VCGATFNVSCPDTATVGSYSSCLIKTTNNTPYKGFYAKVNTNGLKVSSTDFDVLNKYDANMFPWNKGPDYNNGIISAGISSTSYNKEAVVGEITFLVNSTSNSATVTFTGGVTSDESGNTPIYNDSVTKTIKVLTPSSNLKSLSSSIGKISPSFSPNVLNYTLEVDYNTSKISFSADLQDDSSSFVKGYEPREVDLSCGTNKVIIKVKNTNEEEKTYTILVNRNDDRSENNYLKSISVNNVKLEAFDAKVNKYTIAVENSVKIAKIVAVAEDSKAIVNVEEMKKLNEGENIFSIKVTSENGSIRFYKINVKRALKEEILSNNTNIKSILVKDYELNFDNNSKTFYLAINKKDKSLNIKVKLSDDKASYKINGNNNLKKGSIISIKVIAEDKTSDVYRIIIEEKRSFIIPTIILSLLIILIVIIIIIRKRKKPKLINSDLKTEEELNDEDLDKTKMISILGNEKNVGEDDLSDTIVFENKEN